MLHIYSTRGRDIEAVSRISLHGIGFIRVLSGNGRAGMRRVRFLGRSAGQAPLGMHGCGKISYYHVPSPIQRGR